SDIRDASAETFADLDRRAFRANLLTVIGGVLFALGALVALLTLVRLVRRARKPATAAERLIGDAVILRGVGRELNAVQRERESSGWTAELTARALAALRIVGAYALGKRASRTVASPESLAVNGNGSGIAHGGQLVLDVGWPRKRHIAVSGAATPQALAQAIARPTNGHRPGELESVQEALSRFTAAQYARPGNGTPAFDESALDESLRNAQQVLGRLKLEQTWIMRRLGRARKAPPAEMRV